MKIETVENPSFSQGDRMRMVAYNPYVCEVSNFHYNQEPKEIEYKKSTSPFKSKSRVSKELKKGRHLLLSNVLPDDLNYTYFLTLTSSSLKSRGEARIAWYQFQDVLVETFGDFEYVVFFEKSATKSYHIHAIIFDKQHSKSFEFLSFKKIKKLWYGEAKISKPADYLGFIKIAYYLTGFKKYNERISVKDQMYYSSDNINEVPKTSDVINISDFVDKKPVYKSNYRLFNDLVDLVISRTLYLNKEYC